MRGDTWNVRIARSDEEMTIFLRISFRDRIANFDSLLSKGIEGDLPNGSICDF